jgi:hypothetical protein
MLLDLAAAFDPVHVSLDPFGKENSWLNGWISSFGRVCQIELSKVQLIDDLAYKPYGIVIGNKNVKIQGQN